MRKQNQIRRINGPSNYWNNARELYGLYQWNIKYYGGYEDEIEIEYIQLCLLGEHFKYQENKHGFTALKDLLNKNIESHLDGRCGGWLVVNTPLTNKELSIIDEYILHSMNQIPNLLKEFREQNKRSES